MADRIRMFWILLLENRSKNNIFRNKIINLSFNGLEYNTREHFAHCERIESRSHFKSRLSLIVRVNVVLNRNVVVDSD